MTFRIASGYIIPARHHTLVAVRQKRFGIDAALLECLHQDRVGHKLCGPRGYRGFDEYQTFGLDLVANRPHGCFQCGHIGGAGLEVAQVLFDVIALNVHHHTVGQAEDIAVERCGQGLLLDDAALDHWCDFGILCLDRGLTPVQERDLPKTSRTRALTADHEFVRPAGRLIDGVHHDRCHDSTHKTNTHDNDDFLALCTCCIGKVLNALEFGVVISAGR